MDNQAKKKVEIRPGQGVWLIVIAAVLWSTAGLLAKAPQFDAWENDVRGGVIAFWRSVFALLILIPMIRRITWDWKMVPMIGTFAAMNWTYLTALTSGPAANAIWLQNLAAVWVLIFGVVVLRETVTRADVWMAIVCFAGLLTILIGNVPLDEFNIQSWAIVLGFASSVFFAGVVLSLRALREHDPAWLISLNHVGNAICMAAFALRPELIPSGSQWWPLVAIGVFQMGLSYLCFAKGLHSTPSHVASMVALLEPILLPLLVFVAWRNTPGYQPENGWTICGAALIFLGLSIRFVLPILRNNSRRIVGGEN